MGPWPWPWSWPWPWPRPWPWPWPWPRPAPCTNICFNRLRVGNVWETFLLLVRGRVGQGGISCPIGSVGVGVGVGVKITKTWLKYKVGLLIRRIIYAFIWRIIDTYWYLFIFMHICWYLLIFVDVCWYSSIFVDICCYELIFDNIFLYLFSTEWMISLLNDDVLYKMIDSGVILCIDYH